MPAATTGAAWRSRRASFVGSDALDLGCLCQVRFFHHNSQASVSLQYAANLADVNNNPRHIVLFICPSIVASCVIAENASISPYLLKYIPSTSVASPSDVLTVTLVLKSPGAVHYPKELTSPRPANSTDVEFEWFVKICQATTINLHFAKAQFDREEGIRLRSLLDGLESRHLSAPPLNLDREDRGRGLQEGTWHVFNIESSKLDHARSPSVLGKRSRQASSTSQPSKRAISCPTTPPPYSPTEVDTPTPGTRSTVSTVSNNIEPTAFILPPYRKVDSVSSFVDPQVSLLANMLATVPGHVLRQAIVQSGHGCLLGLSSSHAKRDEQQLLVNQSSSPRLLSLIRDMFTTEFESRMRFLVDAGLPLYTKDAIETVMDDYHNQFHVGCQEAEAAIQEKVEDASLEVKMALGDGIREIGDVVDEHIQKMTGEIEAFDDKAELELDNLRCWFVKFAHTLLFEKQASQAGRNVKRCTSI